MSITLLLTRTTLLPTSTRLLSIRHLTLLSTSVSHAMSLHYSPATTSIPSFYQRLHLAIATLLFILTLTTLFTISFSHIRPLPLHLGLHSLSLVLVRVHLLLPFFFIVYISTPSFVRLYPASPNQLYPSFSAASARHAPPRFGLHAHTIRL